MTEYQETEIKLAIPTDRIDALRQSSFWRDLEDAGTLRLRSDYFDSADRRLLRNGFTLRHRHNDGKGTEQTLKWDGPGTRGASRTEWNWPAQGGPGDLQNLRTVEPLRMLRDFDAAALQPLCAVVYQRTKRMWRHNGAAVELSLDIGEIKGGERSLPLSELELELKQGDERSLYDLARQINQILPIYPYTESKGERGLTLQVRGPAGWRKANPAALDPGMRTDEVIAQVMANAQAHLLANVECARLGAHPEGIHQVRVATRRLRSILKTLLPLWPGPREADIEARLKTLASALGPVRDLDVFRTELLPAAEPAVDDAGRMQEFDGYLTHMQADAQAQAGRALTSPEFGALMIDLAEWLNLKAWCEQKVSPQSAQLFSPAGGVLVPHFDRLLNRVTKRGRNFADMEPHRRHRLRIAIKQLRYAVDLFGHLYGRKRVAAYRKRLGLLQDKLGADNDIIMAAHVVARMLERQAPADVVLAGGEVLGWLRHRVADGGHAGQGDWKSFLAHTPPWR